LILASFLIRLDEMLATSRKLITYVSGFLRIVSRNTPLALKCHSDQDQRLADLSHQRDGLVQHQDRQDQFDQLSIP
jgi:hypothetical protein